MIRLIVPNARIIDARRHPMACGFPNYKQHYATGVTFPVTTYRRSAPSMSIICGLMGHFDAVQPVQVHHILNERLIERPELEVRRMFDYLGILNFSPRAWISIRTRGRSGHQAQSRFVVQSTGKECDYWRILRRGCSR